MREHEEDREEAIQRINQEMIKACYAVYMDYVELETSRGITSTEAELKHDKTRRE